MTEEADPDRTIPRGGQPRPVPAGRPTNTTDGDGGADATEVRGGAGDAGQTLLQGGSTSGAGKSSDGKTYVQGGDATYVPDQDAGEVARPAPGLETGRVFADRFEVVSELGEGGMGRVYCVRDRQIAGRKVALKVLRERYSRNTRFRDLFFKEIHAAQGFVSEHVVQLRDTGQMKDGTLFLTMDLVDGEPLDRVLEREVSLVARHALEVARQMLLGLASGHERGFVHRDVKPSNVILASKVPKTEENPFGVGVRLLDFGVAGVAAEVEEGVVIGTPRYMSPEQVQGQRLDARSDLFAVGVLLYEMLTGSRPFEGDTIQAVQTSVLETDLAPLISDLAEVPDPVRRILHKALQKDREKRFQSASEFVEAIEKSKAYTAPTGVPRWVAALLLVFVAASVAEAAMLYLKQKDLDALSVAAGAAGFGGADFSERLARQKREQEADYRDSLKALEDERDRAKADFEQLREERKRVEGDAVTGLEADMRRLEAENKQRAEDYDKLEAKYTQLEREAEEFKTKLTPERRASDLFDELFRRIDLDSGISALKHLDAEEISRATYIPVNEGQAHVKHVVLAAASLETAGRLLPQMSASASDPADRKQALKALADAKRSLVEARDSQKAFEVESRRWIATRPPDGIERDRLAWIAQVRERLEAQAAGLDLVAAQVLEQDKVARRAELEALLATRPEDDPAAAIQYMNAYGSEELGILVERFATWAEGQWAPSGGLDLEPLQSSKPLETWSAWLLAEGSSLRGEAATTILCLWAARLWYAGKEPGVLEPLVADRSGWSVSGELPHADWRSQLALAVALAKESPSQYPQMDSGVAFLHNLPVNGKGIWIRDRCGRNSSGNGNSWSLARETLRDDGIVGSSSLNLNHVSVVRNGDTLEIAGAPALHLRENGDHVLVALWKPSREDLELPDVLKRNLDQPRFLERVLAAPIPCLVYRSRKIEYWYAPGYGLVRQVSEGGSRQELAYSEGVR